MTRRLLVLSLSLSSFRLDSIRLSRVNLCLFVPGGPRGAKNTGTHRVRERAMVATHSNNPNSCYILGLVASRLLRQQKNAKVAVVLGRVGRGEVEKEGRSKKQQNTNR